MFQGSSRRGPNALVVVRRGSTSRGLFGRKDWGDGGGVVHRYVATSKASPRAIHAASARWWPCGRFSPHAVAVEELVTAATAMRKVLATATTVCEVVAHAWPLAVQRVGARAVFVGEVNALAVAVLAGGGRGVVVVRKTVARDAALRGGTRAPWPTRRCSRRPLPCGRCSWWP